MTLAVQTPYVIYTGDGSTVNFSIPFEYFDSSSNIEVILRDNSVTPPTETTLSLTTHYTVNTGTDIVTTVSTYSSTKQIYIGRIKGLSQEKDFVNSGAFVVSEVEDGLDKLLSMIQQVDAKANRAIQMEKTAGEYNNYMPKLDTHANKLIAVNDNENGFEFSITLDDFLADVAAAAASASAASASASSASSSASSAASSSSSASTSASAAASSASAAASSASSASTSATNAATSASSASSSASSASTSASNASTSASNASTSATNAATSASNASTSATNASNSATAAAASATLAASSVTIATKGTYSSPKSIVAGTGFTDAATNMDSTKYFQKTWVSGTGGVTLTANPQIQDGTLEGSEFEIIGTSDSNWVELVNGTGLVLNGNARLLKNYRIRLCWDSTQDVWCESSRNF